MSKGKSMAIDFTSGAWHGLAVLQQKSWAGESKGTVGGVSALQCLTWPAVRTQGSPARSNHCLLAQVLHFLHKSPKWWLTWHNHTLTSALLLRACFLPPFCCLDRLEVKQKCILTDMRMETWNLGKAKRRMEGLGGKSGRLKMGREFISSKAALQGQRSEWGKSTGGSDSVTHSVLLRVLSYCVGWIQIHQ